MNLSLSEDQQGDMRYAFHDGAPGILVSGLVWLTAALAGQLLGVKQGVWALLIGGALMHPLSMLLAKALGRPASTARTNALNGLAMASTIWLILCCAMAYGLFLLRPVLFFPAMMATIGSRYLVFASIYGLPVYWIMGLALILAGALALFLMLPPVAAAGIGGFIEVLFAVFVFARSRRVQLPPA